MKNHRNIFLFFLLLLMGNFGFALGINSVSIFRDQKGLYNIEDIADKKFQPIKQGKINLGYTNDIVWLKISLDSRNSNESQFLNFTKPIHDSLSFFQKRNGKWFAYHAGIATKDSLFAFHSGYYFPLNGVKQSKTIYVRSKSVYAQDLNFQVVNDHVFNRNENTRRVIYGIMIGAILIIVLYNLFLGFSIKDTTYYFYAITGISSLAGQLSLLGFFNSNQWGFLIEVKHILIPLFITSVKIFGAIFSIQFLELRKYNNTARKIIWFIVGFNIVQLITCLLLNSVGVITPYISSSIGGVLFVLSTLYGGIVAMRAGNKNAKYYLIAGALILSSVAVLGLKGLGFIPSNIFTNNFFWVASICEILLLSLALASRYKQWQQEKNEAQKKIEFQQMDLDRIATDNSKRNEYKNGLIDSLKKIASSDGDTKSELKALVFDYDLPLTSGIEPDNLDDKKETVDVEFKKSLISKYPTLTESEVEICGYVFMGLANNEIAVFRSSNSMAIKSARYRIRKKMKLEKSQNMMTALKALRKNNS